MKQTMSDEARAPKTVDRSTFQAELDALRLREKAHTREGDAIAAARRRLPMVKVNGATPLVGQRGAVTLLDAFEGRQMLIAYYFMWHAGHPAPQQCEGCTWVTSKVRELSYIHSRDVPGHVLPRPVRKERPSQAWVALTPGGEPQQMSACLDKRRERRHETTPDSPKGL